MRFDQPAGSQHPASKRCNRAVPNVPRTRVSSAWRNRCHGFATAALSVRPNQDRVNEEQHSGTESEEFSRCRGRNAVGEACGMLIYIGRRLSLALITCVAISVLTFIIIRLPPGDFVDAYIANLASTGSTVTAEQAQAMRHEYGLDRPVYVQYLLWITRVVYGDFGVSMMWRRPVTEVIGDRLWLTMVVSFAALFLTWTIALPIGIYSAVRQYSIGDYIATMLGFIGLAIPNFLLALILMYFGFRYLGLSVGGLFSAEYAQAPWDVDKVWDLAKHVPLPACVLALAGSAQLIRIMRANLLDELRKPYVTTARAKGIPERRVILKYPVRAALNPFASSIAYVFPYLVSGSIIVSLVLGLPTVGPLLLQALVAQDMYLAGTIVLLLGVMTVVGTLISDMLLMWIEPRLRLTGRS
jgi:peptide/nickel transport system permease protein